MMTNTTTTTLLSDKVFENLQKYEADGKAILKNSEDFRDIATVMEHPEFRSFYDKHFQNAASLTSIMLFLKTYEEIEKTSPIPLNPFQKIAILKSMLDHSRTRQMIVQGIREWGGNKDIPPPKKLGFQY